MSFRTTAIVLAVMYAAFGIAAPALAQNVTSGSISGVAVDQQGAVLPGVTIDAVHGPTGTQYSAITDADGRFFISSVRVGGPYTVTAALSGFRSQEQANVTVPLGETIEAGFQAAAGERQPKPSRSKPKSIPSSIRRAPDLPRTSRPNSWRTCRPCRAASKTSRARRRTSRRSRSTPSPARSRSPDATTDTTASRSTARSTTTCSACPPPARRPARPNRSRSASTPSRSCSCSSRPTTCGRAVSRAAASTRSPSREPTRCSGTAYYLGRSESFVGDYTDPIHREPVASLRRVQREARRRKHRRADCARTRAFFFGNFEMNRRGVPSGFSVGGSEGVDFGREAEANRILNTLKTKYNYDPGGLDQFTRAIDNNKFFVRGDVNLELEPPLDGASQLHRRDQRHRPAEPHRVLLPGLLLPFPQQDQFDRRAAEQHLRPHVQRASRQLPARARRPRRRYRVPGAVDRARARCRRRSVQSRDASGPRRPTSWTRTSSR